MQGIYAITDPTLLDGRLEQAVRDALRGGIRLLQYRNKSSPADKRLTEARLLKALCSRYGVPLLINDDVGLCLDAGADGVHLGQSDGSVEEARRRLGPGAIIGVTCHDRVDTALQAEAAGASYAAFGRFFPSLTKPGAPAAPITVLRQARAQLSIPIVAIGGINAENGASLIEAGADMLAVINSLFAPSDVSQSALELSRLFSQSNS